MAYTTIDKPSDYFTTKLYTGNGSTQTISSVGFQPNLTWIKHRDGATAHMIFDSVRGALYRLQSNSSNGETSAANTLTSWNSDGFALGTENDTNGSGRLFVSWNWKAGTAFTNDASATGIGSIDSSGSVNTDAGFSIISYTGTATNGTIAHGLGVAPSLIIIKNYSTSINWSVNSQPLNALLGDYTRYLTLDSNSAVSGAGNTQYQNSAFTSSVFNVGTNATTNGNGNSIIAYCFAEKQGYSKFGSYTGNGNADGTFVYTGFKPAFVIVKRTDSSSNGNWTMHDNKRPGFNHTNKTLYPNQAYAEDTGLGRGMDLFSNGFKFTGTDEGNTSGAAHIYMAFAENPFVTSTGVPACAR